MKPRIRLFSVLKTIAVLVLLTGAAPIKAQTVIPIKTDYYDYELDNLPHIKLLTGCNEFDGAFLLNRAQGRNFDDAIELIINLYSDSRVAVERVYGLAMIFSSFSYGNNPSWLFDSRAPNSILGVDSFWFKVDSHGRITDISFLNSHSQDEIVAERTKALQLCFQDFVTCSVINPAIVDFKPVSCWLFYRIEEAE